MSFTATFLSTTSFSLVGDQTSSMVHGRAIRAYCGVDGYKYGYVDYATYSSATTVNLISSESDALTANLTTVDFSAVKPISKNSGNVDLYELMIQRGYRSGLQLTVASTSSVYIDPGAVHIDDGTYERMYLVTARLTKSLTSLSASTRYAVYAKPPTNGVQLTTSEIEYTSTAPTESTSKLGWYHPTSTTWRCIGYATTDGSSNVVSVESMMSPLMTGRSGGQTIIGGVAASETLTLLSTSHATKGKIYLGASSAYDSANVRLGIGTTAPGGTIHTYLAPTDPINNTMAAKLENWPTYTGAETALENYSVIQGLVRPIINTGHTNSGTVFSVLLHNLRNGNGAAADDSGTLANLSALSMLYGHLSTNASATPQTTNAYGIVITPYHSTGTITNMYDLYLAAPGTGGTATNRWGIYQENTAKNYFGGSVGIGTTHPTYTLQVVGNSRLVYSANDPVNTNTLIVDHYPTYTGSETVSEDSRSFFTNIYPIINTGHNNSGISEGARIGAYRNASGASIDDAGTLSGIRGLSIMYGHSSNNTSTTPQTTYATGLFIKPYYTTGTITEMYDIYMASNVTGGTVTNHWGIFQVNSDKNYFAGSIGIGTTSPAVPLQVGDGTGQRTVRILSGSTSSGDYSPVISVYSLGAREHVIAGSTNGNLIIANTGGLVNYNRATIDAAANITIDTSGKVGIGTTAPTALMDVNSDILRVRTAKTPASAGAAGNAGDICWDASYVYVCVATNSWKRAAIATW